MCVTVLFVEILFFCSSYIKVYYFLFIFDELIFHSYNSFLNLKDIIHECLQLWTHFTNEYILSIFLAMIRSKLHITQA